MLSPVARAGTPANLAIYQAEPYVIAADIHGASPHIGRAGWTWYTGSAGWMYRVAIESVLGFHLDAGRALVLRPRVPSDWPGFTIRYRLPGEETRYVIDARIEQNDDAAEGGADLISASLDGAPIPVIAGAASIPIVHDGATHRVELQLAAKVGARS
jgi:cyclic beta-1,2-glucan synthetase